MTIPDTIRLKLEAAQDEIRRNRLSSMKWVAIAFLVGAMVLYAVLGMMS